MPGVLSHRAIDLYASFFFWSPTIVHDLRALHNLFCRGQIGRPSGRNYGAPWCVLPRRKRIVNWTGLVRISLGPGRPSQFFCLSVASWSVRDGFRTSCPNSISNFFTEIEGSQSWNISVHYIKKDEEKPKGGVLCTPCIQRCHSTFER